VKLPRWFVPVALLLLSPAAALAGDDASPLRHVVTTIEGRPQPLAHYRGKTVLIVNTASRCGFTPQYEGLEQLYKRYQERGLVVLGFPCNDFMGQEPGSEEQIQRFCKQRYGVSFPLFSKVVVKPGPAQEPLFKSLTHEGPKQLRGGVRWNFEKFLIDPQGNLIARFRSVTKPLSEELVGAIEAALPTAKPQEKPKQQAEEPAARPKQMPLEPTPPASKRAPQQQARAERSGAYRTADYFPLRTDWRLTYEVENSSRFRGKRTERLVRSYKRVGDALRVEDSKGEYQEYRMVEGRPAMSGQSMFDQGFEQRYDDPIGLFPAQAKVGERFRFESPIRHVMTRGATMKGQITREVTLAAVETIETPAGRFEDCLRFEAVTRNRLPRMGNFEAVSKETIWLAPGVGEVKSVNETTLGNAGRVWMKAKITTRLIRRAELL